ncbi:spaetzle-processing enzyme-like isoform X2 [Drosophila biarmipes]|uniref:spaetzle-processing enzyme-like isoform X2 n=1 Tax=Drosophila biarmipes TaxID=125945 RepID=UPI0021CC59FE|nr:spaetzle-processing enzyme-like isoform X2 [Drosophila biarmipes]
MLLRNLFFALLLKASTVSAYPTCQLDEECVRLCDCSPLRGILKPRGMTVTEIHVFKDRQCGLAPRGDALLLRVYICCPKQSWILPNSQMCGQTPPAFHVVAGREAPLNGFPWIAMLLYRSSRDWSLVPKCAGSLITNRFVLTAAHCLDIDGFELRTVRLGEHNTSSNPDCANMLGRWRCTARHLEINVDKSISHKDYRVVGGKHYNDIALLRLQYPVRYTPEIQPVCIKPVPEFRNFSFENETMQIAGWGYSQWQSMSNVLLQAYVKGRSADECSGYAKDVLGFDRDSQICAGGQDGTDTCDGDSGGPLMATMGWGVDEFNYLAGITSYGARFGRTCGYGPAVYTKTSHFIEWIEWNMYTNQ